MANPRWCVSPALVRTTTPRTGRLNGHTDARQPPGAPALGSRLPTPRRWPQPAPTPCTSAPRTTGWTPSTASAGRGSSWRSAPAWRAWASASPPPRGRTPDPSDRVAAVTSWPVLPGFASVNWCERGCRGGRGRPAGLGSRRGRPASGTPMRRLWLSFPLRAGAAGYSSNRRTTRMPAGPPFRGRSGSVDPHRATSPWWRRPGLSVRPDGARPGRHPGPNRPCPGPSRACPLVCPAPPRARLPAGEPGDRRAGRGTPPARSVRRAGPARAGRHLTGGRWSTARLRRGQPESTPREVGLAHLRSRTTTGQQRPHPRRTPRRDVLRIQHTYDHRRRQRPSASSPRSIRARLHQSGPLHRHDQSRPPSTGAAAAPRRHLDVMQYCHPGPRRPIGGSRTSWIG